MATSHSKNMVVSKRAAIENRSNDEVVVNCGSTDSQYLTIQRVNLATSKDNCSQVYTLGVRVYALQHSRNLLFIDFRITDPCGDFTIIQAGKFNKDYITWTNEALSIVKDFYPNSMGENSLILTDNLAIHVYKLSRFVKRNTQTIPTSNKTKLAKTKKANYIKRITK